MGVDILSKHLSYKLENFFIGQNDGKKEAAYREDFENYFYNHNGIYQKVQQREKYLVLGRKGTGKSILGEFIKKKSESDSQWLCSLTSYKEFKFHELLHLKTNDITPNEYLSIWEWVLLLEFGKLCLNNQALEYSDTWNKLNKFFKDNFYSLKLNINRIVEITKQNKISGSLLKVSNENTSGGKYHTGTYLNYIEDLREVVMELLEETDCSFTVILDELDDKFRNEDIYKHNIISLIKAADKLNLLMLQRGIKGKALLLLRTDIFYLLNDPDLNKIKIDNSVTIDWGTTINRESPLFDLIINKIKVSVPELKNKSKDEVFSLIFPPKIRKMPPERFLLGRTYFRPRDIITYLNLIIDKTPESTYFKEGVILDLEKDYSTYFFQEVRNELSGHISDEIIDEGTLLLKQFNRPEFKYRDILSYYEKNKSIYPNLNLEDTLKVFFNFGLIGNKWFSEHKRKYFYSWTYRDNKAAIDYNKTFAIHVGLRKELSL